MTKIEEILPINIETTWMTPIYRLLTKDEFSKDELEAKQVIKKFSKYALINGWTVQEVWLSTVAAMCHVG